MLIVVMMVSMMGGVYPMMRENQACAFIRTMNVNDWLEQCRMVAIKVSNEKAKYHGDPGSPTKSGCRVRASKGKIRRKFGRTRNSSRLRLPRKGSMPQLW